ncbi:MAG: flagellar hook-basal body complex protein FliE [Ignavibacteriaceae bacterium]|nr:flagellar hook-basal body complex protein FliE [Ignavibacteriaceae bacterium]
MEINQIGSFSQTLNPIKETPKPGGEAFENVITDFIGQVNNQQHETANLTDAFIHGGDVQLHEVMIAGEKAKTSLDLLMEIRNKAIDMYKELTRIQI